MKAKIIAAMCAISISISTTGYAKCAPDDAWVGYNNKYACIPSDEIMTTDRFSYLQLPTPKKVIQEFNSEAKALGGALGEFLDSARKGFAK